jgi:hypothetical protein
MVLPGRVSALYVAERMRNEVVATVAAHYQQLALVAARRAAVRATHRRTMSRRESVKVRAQLQAGHVHALSLDWYSMLEFKLQEDRNAHRHLFRVSQKAGKQGCDCDKLATA